MGIKDYYVSVIKGAILSEIREANIVDISNSIQPFFLQEAAFVLKNAYKVFPKGTIHIVGVSPEETKEAAHIATTVDGHYFVGADNGIFSLVFDKQPDEIVDLSLVRKSNKVCFPTKEVFVPAGCHLARGGILATLGKKRESLNRKVLFQPTYDSNAIKGIVIHIDSYNNVVTNITENDFRNFGRSRPFQICFKYPDYNMAKISESYDSVKNGEKLAIFGSTGFLEIAMNKGKASSLLGLKLNDTIRIEFYDNKDS